MILHGDCLEKMKGLKDNSVDAIVTDPPYGLSFMGKKWDYDVPSEEIWREALRVLKPGGHLLAFFGTRTYHRGVVRIEDAGFEIRDQIAWIYGSGFPKSQDISKAIDKQAGAEREIVGENPNNRPSKRHGAAGFDSEEEIGTQRKAELKITAPSTEAAKKWQGFGTALKPAVEPVVVARKPIEKGLTIAQNVQKHGTGGLNIDQSRIGANPGYSYPNGPGGNTFSVAKGVDGTRTAPVESTQGRWPANLIFDEDAAAVLDEQTQNLHASGNKKKGTAVKETSMFGIGEGGFGQSTDYGDSGGASRFFYCAKASKAERNRGLEKADLIWESDAWEKPDLKLALRGMHQLAKDTSEDILTGKFSWNTDGFGCSTSELSPKTMTFIISTALKLITELKTSNASRDSNTRESIQDAIKMIEASGLNLAESVEVTSRLKLNTTKGKMASVLGVVHALLQMLLQIKGFAKSGNFHSTVKPLKLMEYLVRMVTPPGGTCLDPFAGSGSTGVAAKKLGFKFIGIEMDDAYVEIARKRIEATA